MSNKQDFLKKVAEIQQNLKIPKGQMNKFGGYAFRSTEDILDATKKVLGDLVLEMTEDMVLVGDKVFKKVTSSLVSSDGEHRHSASAFARESDEPPKGMSSPQNSGSVGSYAAKYSLGRLLLIDDTKDDDATNTHGKEEKASPVSRRDKTKEDIKAAQEPRATEAKETVQPEPEESQPVEVNTRPAGGSFRRRGRA